MKSGILSIHLHVPAVCCYHSGDMVFIPPCSQAPASIRAVRSAKASCTTTTYTVKANDFPASIARMHNMNPGDLLRLNPKLRVRATAKVTVGQVLNVLSCPKATLLPFTSPIKCASFYTVKSGDTAKTVATNVGKGATVSKIMQANTWVMSPTMALPVGRKICIN